MAILCTRTLLLGDLLPVCLVSLRRILYCIKPDHIGWPPIRSQNYFLVRGAVQLRTTVIGVEVDAASGVRYFAARTAALPAGPAILPAAKPARAQPACRTIFWR